MKIYSGVKAYLFGVTEYDDYNLDDIPNIDVNLDLLKDTLSDKSIIGIPSRYIKIFKNLTEAEFKNELYQISKDVKFGDTVLIYFSGHGIYSTHNHELYLTGKDTDIDSVHVNGMSIRNFKELSEYNSIDRKIIVLDACYSGAIHHGRMGGKFSNHLQGQINNYKGSFIISSSSEQESSLYPIDSPQLPSFFTGELIQSLNNGIKNNKPHITLRELYLDVKQAFRKKGMPVPQSSEFNELSDAPIAKNKSYNLAESGKHTPILDQSLVPHNHVFLFHGPRRGATTFISSFIRTMQHSQTNKVLFYSKKNKFLKYYSEKIVKQFQSNCYPEKTPLESGHEIDLGIENLKLNKKIRFSFLNISGEHCTQIIEQETPDDILHYYLKHSKVIILMTAVGYAVEDDLFISKMLQKLQDMRIDLPIELIVNRADELDKYSSLKLFIKKNMPNTYSWTESRIFKSFQVHPYTVLYKKHSDLFNTKENIYAKQFANRLWKNITGRAESIIRIGSKAKNDFNPDKAKQLLSMNKMKPLFNYCKSGIPDMTALMEKIENIEKKWHKSVKDERFDIIAPEDAQKIRINLRFELIHIIDEVLTSA